MTATNHAITGAIIATVITNPLIGLPLAFLSHFVLDSLPHFGNHPDMPTTSKAFRNMLIFDGVLAIALALFVFTFAGDRWWVTVLGGVLAVSPDLMWVPHYIDDLRGRDSDKRWNPVSRIHKAIQRWETPSGYRVEMVWFFGSIVLLYILLTP